MFVILIVIAALFILGKGGFNFIAASGQPVPLNATGASLTTALGTVAAPPSYYSTGNPGYNATPAGAPAPSVAAPIQPSVQQTAARTTAPAQVVHNPSTTQINNTLRAGPPNRFAPPVVQPVNIRTRIVGPEQATPFWSKTATIIRPSRA